MICLTRARSSGTEGSAYTASHMLGFERTNSATSAIQLFELQRVEASHHLRAAHDLVGCRVVDDARRQDRLQIARVLAVRLLVILHEVHLIVGEPQHLLEPRGPARGPLRAEALD